MKDLPDEIEVNVGSGGRGGEIGAGKDGEDSSFGDFLRAKGGRGGREGGLHAAVRQIDTADIDNGFNVSTIMLAECVHFRNGLLYLLGGGWESYSIPRIPFEVKWPLVCAVTLGKMSPGTMLELWAVVSDPSGSEITRHRFDIPTGSTRDVRRPSNCAVLQFTAHCEGVWMITMRSGAVELAQLPVEIWLSD